MAVGAGIATAQVADDLGVTISVVGTPAEALGGGGKIILLERGAFAGVHAAMMVHPSPADSIAPLMLANAHFSVRYRGKEAHASAYPELGINAADALTVAPEGPAVTAVETPRAKPPASACITAVSAICGP